MLKAKFRFKSMEILTPPSSSSSSSSSSSRSSTADTKLLQLPILSKCLPRFAAFPFTVVLLFLFLPLTTAASAAGGGISYSDHCNDVVRIPPLLPSPNPPLISQKFLSLRNAHVESSANGKNKTVSAIPMCVSLSTHRAYNTQNDAIFKIEAVLGVSGAGYPRNFTRRGLRRVHIRPPRFPVTSGDSWNAITFALSGFWDSISGKLCMVGSGFGKSSSNHVVLKLDYLNSSSIFTSLVNGTLESLDMINESGLTLKSISILGVNLRNYYKYELIDKESEGNGFSMLEDMTNVSLGIEDLGQKLCKYIISAGTVELEYNSDCNSVNCNFLGRGNGNFTPSLMYFNQIECLDDGRVRFLLGFGDHGYNGYRLPFEPNVTLVSEGKWDWKKMRLNMVGCRVFRDGDEGFVGECLIRLSLRFPSRWTLRDRSFVVGELWSSRSVNESGYFGKITFSSMKNKNVRTAGLRYEYTEIENIRGFCANRTMQKGKTEKYPNALSSDMRFDMVARNKKLKGLWGYSSPLFVGNRPYQSSTLLGRETEAAVHEKHNFSSSINVSYILQLSSSHDLELSNEHKQINSLEISAEGTYDYESGHLCMAGCMQVGQHRIRVGRNLSLDCEILVDVQFPALESSGDAVKGTIQSKRDKLDSLYFEPLEIFSRSIYAGQAKDSIFQMDLEITMVLISNTLSCIFLILQLLHVRRHAEVLPSISIIMLSLLTLGHLFPLLLNFEALFMMTRNSVNVYFGTDGWLEVNEVLVRVITMIAFLLEFRLVQMSWSSRSGNDIQNNFSESDKKVVYLSLPMYIGGGLIALFVHLSKPARNPPFSRIRHFGYKQESLWGDLKSYAGLILDGFLLPQILFNLFSNSKGKALAPSFYIGTTFVRLLPHAYDLYRSHSSTWAFDYIYANPKMDFYSTTWDIAISVGGVLFVVLIYLQQRYGGRCFVPNRLLHSSSSYEKVPVANVPE